MRQEPGQPAPPAASPTYPVTPARELATEASGLLAEVAADPYGQVGVSVYDSGRLVALAPWLAGHGARREFLCQRQGPDGGWGGPADYCLVPALSATAGLLAELRRGVDRATRDRLGQAATGGLRALHRWLAPDAGTAVADTVASELIVPALVAEVNRLLAGDPGIPGVPDQLSRPLRLPDGVDQGPLDRTRQRFLAGRLPPATVYCLEVFGTDAASAPGVHPAMGAVGCSPAATAAWVGGPGGPPECLDYLDRRQARGNGPTPVVSPITFFEPAWVLNSLGAARVAADVPTVVLDRLEAGVTGIGTPVAPGLPPDADDTGTTLAALLRHGRVHPPDQLMEFRADGYFHCYPGERNPSLSTNTHVLEALALYLAQRPADRSRFGTAAAMVARWLLDQQHADGGWSDKWHASPYYATACSVVALSQHGGRGAAQAVARAVEWVAQTQRPDGSWGQWQGTVEETAYAVQILCQAPPERATNLAIRRGCQFLSHPALPDEYPPLWHGKDLYTPVRVVRAARLAALWLGARRGGAPPAQRRGQPPPHAAHRTTQHAGWRSG